MKGYVCLFVVLAGTALFAQSNASPEETAVLGVQRQWLEASQKGNGEVLRQIIDDSFVGSTPDNHIINKQSLIPPSGSEPTFARTHFAGLDAKVIGDTAVVFGKMITPGEPTALRCAMVYRKQAGAWKMIAAQLVPVSETKE
ncbi:MAG TPA: nuclear transport factor 2 family protein [Terriglobales bacterium]|nr:nuclear transport factor 2 family protein [Terriglobales bacterium]